MQKSSAGKNSLLIGPLPKNQASGVSLGFDSLVSGFRSAGLPFCVVDTVRLGMVANPGRLNARRAMGSLMAVISAWYRIPGAHSVYMTIASSRLGFLRDFLIIWAAVICRKRIITHLKGGGYAEFYANQPAWLRGIIRETLNRVTNIVVLGELLKSQFDFVDRSDEGLIVIPNGLLPGSEYAESSGKSIQDGETIRLLYLSNMVPSKGYMDLLKACELLRSRGVDICCDFCGAFLDPAIDKMVEGKDLKRQFQAEVDKLGLERVVVFHGTVRGERKRALLSAAHVFVLPTYYPWEGQPISIIEALAVGTPVISTAYKGIPEQVLDGFNGRLVSPCEPSEIANAVESIVADEDAYRTMSQNCIRHFEKHFRREVHLERLVSLISNSHVPADRFVSQQ